MFYTNCDEITLVVNGVEVATKAAVDHAVVFEAVELKDGANTITAKADGVEDTITLNGVAELIMLMTFRKEMKVRTGSGAMSMTSVGMGKEMQEFMNMMTLSNMLKMAGGAMTADQKYELNEKLNKIAK